MKIKNAAKCLAKLVHSTNLSIYRLLVQAGHRGLTVGEIGKRLGIAPTTLNHHLEHLRGSNLIRKEREGRYVWCHANFELMGLLIQFLSEDCCVEEK